LNASLSPFKAVYLNAVDWPAPAPLAWGSLAGVLDKGLLGEPSQGSGRSLERPHNLKSRNERRGDRKAGTPNKIIADIKAMIGAALNAKGGQAYLDAER
jgi:hypothetical protein